MSEMQNQILRWMLTGDVGASSQTMAHVIALDEKPRRASYPHHAGDFGLCLGLLEAAPEAREHLYKMKQVSPVWEKLVDSWAKLEALYRAEKQSGAGMRKTYELIKELTVNASEIRFGNVSIIFE